MGCGTSVQIQEENRELEPEIEALDVPWTEPNYPPPVPPKTRSAEVFNIEDYKVIDERAKHCPMMKAESYDSLLAYLTDGLVTDMEKLRSVFTWIGMQDIDHTDFKSADRDTPKGYLQLLKQKRGTYSAFLALLLRKVNIPCVIVYGISKSFDYDVGDRDVYHLRNCWNAVHVDGEWRLIHPLWSYRKVQGYSKGRWMDIRLDTLKDEDLGESKKGVEVVRQDEFFFLVEPDVFIYMCRPAADMSAWQLLKSPWTFEDFIRAPVLKQKYFEFRMNLLSELSSTLIADSLGIIQFSFEDGEETEMAFAYELFFDDRASFNKLPADIKLERYVCISRRQNKLSLQARLPVSGIYKLRLYGGITQLHHLCDFRLESEAISNFPKPYPFRKRLTYGFTRTSRLRGLQNPSEPGGIIKLQAGQGKFFTFIYMSELDIQAILEHCVLTTEELRKCVAVKRKNGHFNVYVNVPAGDDVEEYSLQVYTRPRGSSEHYKNAINYLLIMDPKPEEPKSQRSKSRQTQFEMEARRTLRSALERSSISALETAITRIQRLHLESPDELKEAKQKRELLILQRDLHLAIARRRLDFLERALERASRHKDVQELEGLVKEAWDVKAQLTRLTTFLHDVLEITQPTISEMHNYTRPKPIIHDVMRATYILLGEDDENLERWEFVQGLMRKVGRNGLVSRLRKFDVINVHLEKVETVQAILSKYDEDSVKTASLGAGTFFVWCQNIVVEMAVSLHNEIQKYRARRG